MKQQTIETMKTLEQVKEEYAIEKGFEDWIELQEYYMYWDSAALQRCINEIAKRYATEYAKEALRLASINADTKMQRYNDLQDIIVVDKETILSDYNLPEHR